MNKGDNLYCVLNLFGFALTVTMTQNGAKILHQIENSQELKEDRCFYFTTQCTVYFQLNVCHRSGIA